MAHPYLVPRKKRRKKGSSIGETMKKATAELSTRIYARIYNEELLRQMDALIAQERYGSKSEIVGKCVEIALPLLVAGKANLPASGNDKIAEAIKRQGATLRDMNVLINMTFNLLTSLFTEKTLALDGIRTNAEDLKSGVYEQLPEHYQDVLNELLK